MRRWACILALCLLLPHLGCAQSAPATMAQCATVEEVMALLLFPQADEAGQNQPVPVRRGTVRYVSQALNESPWFCKAYWRGGQPGDELDLNLYKDKDDNRYVNHVRIMCTRAVYSMALSYLGVDVTPGDMSAMLGQRGIPQPYASITDRLEQVEQVALRTTEFRAMFDAYLTDPAYSPIYMHFTRPDGTIHALLIVARTESGAYLVVDPAHHEKRGNTLCVYQIVFTPDCLNIVNSTYRRELAGSRVRYFYQWRLVEPEE